jgi:hypothetical protein
MGGSIACVSKPGAGSTFTFTLPLSETGPEEADDDDAPARLVLLVDPRPEARSQLANHLRRSGFALSPAGTNAEAWRRARGLRPDIVLLEACQENIDAPGLAARMNGDPATSHIPIRLTGVLDRALVLDTSSRIPEPVRSAIENDAGRVLLFGSPEIAAECFGPTATRWLVEKTPPAVAQTGAIDTEWLLVEFENDALIHFGRWLREHPECTARIGLYGRIPDTVQPLGKPGVNPVSPGAHARRVLAHLRELRRRESSARSEVPDA